jgi:phenylacetate-coenzyme A ligase PaaK-like adenylate-forming protein
MTSVAEEKTEQRRWRPRPQYAHLPYFDSLLESEFYPADRQRELAGQGVHRVLRFACSEVPFYRAMFERLRLSPDDFKSADALTRLPILTRRDLIEHEEALRAQRLPAGERVAGYTMSSGTTGRPTRVAISVLANMMFTLLSQRRYRWFRFDPSAAFVEIRAPHLLPRRPDGSLCPPDQVLKMGRWRYVGVMFETGPYVAFSLAHPPQQIIAWLREHDPAYLCSYPGVLEELAFACVDHRPNDGLRALLSVASQLTEPMRRRIQETFGLPLHQGYGLNEIGQVAAECEAGRFHVHAEHCHVEIVDDDGQPCRPGQLGRILVTGLQNLAMPLVRYDTDDAAMWMQGPCPCGRTLPSFGRLAGRLRRFAVLPEGTRPRVNVLLETIESAPPAMLANLRRYQIHQHRDGRFELRVQVAAALPDEFGKLMRDVWRQHGFESQGPLEIVTVDDIPLGPSGKRQDFTSDFYDDQGASADSATVGRVGGT